MIRAFPTQIEQRSGLGFAVSTKHIGELFHHERIRIHRKEASTSNAIEARTSISR